MFLKTLPVVPMSARTLNLPASRAVTTFFLPKIAEQGLRVPVREIDGNYLSALQNRLDAILGHPLFSQSLSDRQRKLLQGLSVDHNATVRGIVPSGGVLKSDYEVDIETSEALIHLLINKDLNDVEPLGLRFSDAERVLLESAHLPYLHLLYGLELTGAVRGIVHDYDVFSANEVPSHSDIRRIQVARHNRLGLTLRRLRAKMNLPKNEDILPILESGREIDGDAGPLLDFFHRAIGHLEAGHADQITGLAYQANVFVTDYPQGRHGRNQIVSKTVVEARH